MQLSIIMTYQLFHVSWEYFGPTQCYLVRKGCVVIKISMETYRHVAQNSIFIEFKALCKPTKSLVPTDVTSSEEDLFNITLKMENITL